MKVGSLLVVLAALFVPLGLWTDRTLDFWLTRFCGHVVDVPFWASLLVGFVAPFTFLMNLVSEIARCCL